MVPRGMKESNWVLLLLLFAYISGQWSRFSLPYLAGVAIDDCSIECEDATPPLCPSHPGSSPICDFCYANVSHASKYNIKQATCLSEEEYSFLVSYAFIALFATCGLFAGRLADVQKFSRRNIVILACVGWSASTFIQSYAHDFSLLLVSRLLMGAFTSFSAPASYSMLADVFETKNLATANGVYAMGVYLGGGMSSLSIAFAHMYGWRAASNAVAGFGLVVSAALFLLISEPRRQRPAEISNASAKLSFGEALRQTFRDPVVRVLLLGSCLRFLGGFSLGAYLPQFFKNTFPKENSQFSVLNAGVVAVAGSTSSVLGGKLSDVLEARLGRGALLTVPIFGSVTGLVFILMCLHENEHFYLSVFELALSYLLVECWFGPVLKILQGRIPAESKATGISVYLFSGSMLGNVGPVIVGQVLGGKSEELVDVLSTIMVISYLGCSLCFAVAAVWIGKEVAQPIVATPLLGENSSQASSSEEVGQGEEFRM